jgi:hypothetical protein
MMMYRWKMCQKEKRRSRASGDLTIKQMPLIMMQLWGKMWGKILLDYNEFPSPTINDATLRRFLL